MGNQKKSKNHDDDKKQVLVNEFNVSMHCNACERSVAKAISKIKGVKKFITDMPRHKVIVMGEIKPEKVVKQIKKKTGKIAKIIERKEEEEEGSRKEEEGKGEGEGEGEGGGEKENETETETGGEEGEGLATMNQDYYSYHMESNFGFDCFSLDAHGYSIFSDENPNSCSVM